MENLVNAGDMENAVNAGNMENAETGFYLFLLIYFLSVLSDKNAFIYSY